MENKVLDAYLEKRALSSWKANIGKLGEQSLAKLESSGILNHAKEMQGLNTGSANIVKRYGGKVTSMNNDEIANHLNNALRQDSGFRAMTRGKIDLPKGNNANLYITENVNRKAIVNQTMGAVTASEGHIMLPYGKTPIVNKGKSVHPAFSTGNAEDEAYSHALLHRHEVDELRYAQTARSKPSTSMDIGGSNIPTTSFQGHMSPKIIVRESSNVAVAPKSIKDKFTEARTSYMYGQEGNMIKHDFPNFNYGESAKFDKTIGTKGEKMISKVVRPQMQAYKDSIT